MASDSLGRAHTLISEVMDKAILLGHQNSITMKRGSILSVGNNHKLLFNNPSIEIERISNDRITSIESMSEASSEKSLETYNHPGEKSGPDKSKDYRFSFNTPAF